jgi:hypothetical protein
MYGIERKTVLLLGRCFSLFLGVNGKTGEHAREGLGGRVREGLVIV